MSSSNLIRWSGLSALVGGALMIASDVINAVLFPGEQGSQVMLSSTWFIVQILGLVALVLITLGLVGLYACQAQQAGSLGLIAFVIAFAGMLMVFGLLWGEPFLGPLVAEQAPGLLSAEPSGALAVGSILSFVLFALGWLLLGLASLRAGTLPRGAAARPGGAGRLERGRLRRHLQRDVGRAAADDGERFPRMIAITTATAITAANPMAHRTQRRGFCS